MSNKLVDRLLLSTAAIMAIGVVLLIKFSKPLEPIDTFCHDFIVDVTVYRINRKETNKRVNITASGFVIRDDNAKILAVSRDLLAHYPYGTIVEIDHPEINRIHGRLFVVLDTMNKRIKNTIDILVTKDDQVLKWRDVKIKRVT